MKKLLIALFLTGFFTLFAQSVEVDFSGETAGKVKSGKNAVIENSLLNFKKVPATASVSGTKNLDFTDGGTLMMVVRVADFSSNPTKSRFLVQKNSSFLFGITDGKYNFSLCNNGVWSIALIGGTPSEDNDFVHLAAVVRKVNNHEQSEVGFFMDVYVNGEKIMGKFHPVREYSAAKTDNIRFNSLNHFFTGEIANFSFTTKVLTAGEIAEAVKKNPLIKIKPAPGIFEVKPEISEKLKKLAPEKRDGIPAFTIAALTKAAANGAPEKKILRAANAIEKLNRSFTAEQFNAAQKDFVLLETSNGTAMLILGECGAAFPVLDVFDPQTGSGIFGSRSNSWLIRYHRGKEKYCRLNDFTPGVRGFCKLTRSGNGKYEFSITWDHELLKVVSNGRFSADGLKMDIASEAKKDDVIIANCRFPYYIFKKKSGADYLVTPYYSGRLVANPAAGYEFGSNFPRISNAMQFQAYFGGRKDGIYVAMEDPQATGRYSGVFGKNNELYMYWQTACAVPPAGAKSKFSLGADSRIALYKGEWFEAGQIYKKFLSGNAAWWIKNLPRTSTPEWFRNNSIWILAGVFPNRNEATLLYLRKYFEQSIGVHLVGHTSKRIWPHFDKSSVDGLRRRGNLQRAGMRVVAYSDPRIYSKRRLDGKIGYTPETLKMAVKNEQKQPAKESYGDECLVMCPGYKVWQDEYLRICLGMAQNGFDGIYHDQLPCAQPVACFSKEHGHLVNDPSIWLEKGNNVMFRQIHKQLDRLHPGMVHTGEDASEPYLQMLDGYMTWRWIQKDQIPLFQSIYSGRVQFVGKLYNHQNPGEWDSNFAKAANQIIFGEQLGWLTLEDLEAATPFRKYYKVLSFVRKAVLKYFNTGEMAAPVEFIKAPEVRTLNWGESSKHRSPQMVPRPVIESSAWVLPDGRKMMLFINSSDSVERATVKLDSIPRYFYICKQSSAEPQAAERAEEIVLQPYGVEVWLLSEKTDNRDEALKTASILHRTSKFDEGRTLTIKKVVNQKVPEFITPENGKSVPVTLAAKYTNTFKRYYANGEDRDTVLILYNGSTLLYKGVKLENASVELNIAYDSSEAGGVFELLVDGKVSGRATLNTPGKYLGFQTLSIPLEEKLSGTKNLEFRFSGRSCRIKGFTVRSAK